MWKLNAPIVLLVVILPHGAVSSDRVTIPVPDDRFYAAVVNGFYTVCTTRF